MTKKKKINDSPWVKAIVDMLKVGAIVYFQGQEVVSIKMMGVSVVVKTKIRGRKTPETYTHPTFIKTETNKWFTDNFVVLGRCVDLTCRPGYMWDMDFFNPGAAGCKMGDAYAELHEAALELVSSPVVSGMGAAIRDDAKHRGKKDPYARLAELVRFKKLPSDKRRDYPKLQTLKTSHGVSKELIVIVNDWKKHGDCPLEAFSVVHVGSMIHFFAYYDITGVGSEVDKGSFELYAETDGKKEKMVRASSIEGLKDYIKKTYLVRTACDMFGISMEHYS